MPYATVVHRKHHTLTARPGKSVMKRNVFHRRWINLMAAKMFVEPFPIMRNGL